MNVFRKKILLVFVSVIVPASCMMEQEIALNSDLSGTWEIDGRALPFAGAALDDLAMLGGYTSAAALYDESLTKAHSDLTGREGMQLEQIQRTSDHAWNGILNFDNVEELLGSAETGGFVRYSNQDGIAALQLLFSRDTASQLENLVPLLKEPAFSLFNPSTTVGLSEEIYTNEILGFTFGADNIPAIRRARIGLNLKLPGTVTKVQGGTQIDSRQVRFETSFARFMVPEDPIIWSVSWRSL